MCLGDIASILQDASSSPAPRLTQRRRAKAREIVKKTAMHRLHRLLPRVALATSPLLAGGLATKTPARSQSTATQKTLRVAVVQMPLRLRLLRLRSGLLEAVRMRVCVDRCMYACMCVCMYVCMYVCACCCFGSSS